MKLKNTLINLACTICLSLCLPVHADFTEVKEKQLISSSQIAFDTLQTIARYKRYHYLPIHLNDETSSKIFDEYFRSLDRNKLYFTAKDIQQFESYRYKIDDLLEKGQVDLGFEIFKLYRKRVDQQTKLSQTMLKMDFDFTVDESIDFDNKKLDWATSSEEMYDRWRKRVKYDLLTQLLSENDLKKARKHLKKRYTRQRNQIFQLTSDEVFEFFINAYSNIIGPHTQYMSDYTRQNFEIGLSLELEGIGAVLSTDLDTDTVKIVEIVKGGPADKSKQLKADDRIVGVGQDEGKVIDITGWRLSDVVKKIRGKKGTTVHLKVVKHAAPMGTPPIDLTITRDIIELQDQAAKLSEVKLDNGQRYSVIQIPSFYYNNNKHKSIKSTSEDVEHLLHKVKENNTNGLIIDLRGNGGGFLTEAIKLTGLFIDKGPVVQVVSSVAKKKIHNDPESGTAYAGPMVVLIDRYSASASEIFAAAMQDYGRAIIIGERSFGKGSVQSVTPLQAISNKKYQAQVKFTTAQFFRINGGSTQFKGVTPDITFSDSIEDTEFGERAYENALPWSEIKAASYSKTSFSPELIDHLQKNHLARSKSSLPGFAFLKQQAQRRYDNKNKKVVSLNLGKRQSEYQELETLGIKQLNDYRKTLGLPAVTKETIEDNPLPDEDEHWEKVYQREGARILDDLLQFQPLASSSNKK